MVRLEYLSDNLVLILQELVNNQKIVKYVNYTQNDPQAQPNITLPATSLIQRNVLPYPFDINVKTDDTTQIHVYYPKGDIKNFTVVENIDVLFDIVVAKNLWLTNDGKSAVRPYEIMKEIINGMDDKSIGTLGKLKFRRFIHVPINDRFDCVRLVAEMFTLGS